MKNKVFAFLGILAVVLTAAFVFQPEGFVPLFDADLTRLAMSSSEAHCSAVAFISGGDRATKAAECRETDGRSKETDLIVVTPMFCQYVSGAIESLTYTECVSIMHGKKLWPTYDGGLTASWSRSAPYPLSELESPLGDLPDEGRTGGREEIQRQNVPH